MVLTQIATTYSKWQNAFPPKLKFRIKNKPKKKMDHFRQSNPQRKKPKTQPTWNFWKKLKSRNLDQRLAAPRDWGLSLWILMVVTPRQNVHWASKRSTSQRDPPSGGCQIWEKARLGKAGCFFHSLFLISFLVFSKAIVCVFLVNGHVRYIKK